MNLNTVLCFGDLLDWNSAVTLSLMIIGLLLLALLIVWLILWLIKLARMEAVAVPAEEKVVKTRVERVIVRESAEPRVVVVQQQPVEPQVIVVQQSAPAPQVVVQQPAPEPVVEQQLVVVRPQAEQPAPPPAETIVVPAPSQPVYLPLSAEEEDDFDDEEEVLVEETFEGGVVTYNRSFMAKYIQASDETKDYYVHLKNKLLSYIKVRARISWKRESFTFGRSPMARLVFRGKTLCLCLPLDPGQFAESKYHVEDVSNIALYADTPCMYRIRNDRRLNYAYELIDFVAQNVGTKETNRHYEDYYMPYEGLVQLIDKGLVKRVIRYTSREYVAPQPEANPEPAKSRFRKKK